MSRREIAIAAAAGACVLMLVLMVYVTVLGVLGQGLTGGLMTRTSGVMRFVMVGFPLIAVAALGAVSWWIVRREGG